MPEHTTLSFLNHVVFRTRRLTNYFLYYTRKQHPYQRSSELTRNTDCQTLQYPKPLTCSLNPRRQSRWSRLGLFLVMRGGALRCCLSIVTTFAACTVALQEHLLPQWSGQGVGYDGAGGVVGALCRGCGVATGGLGTSVMCARICLCSPRPHS